MYRICLFFRNKFTKTRHALFNYKSKKLIIDRFIAYSYYIVPSGFYLTAFAKIYMYTNTHVYI